MAQKLFPILADPNAPSLFDGLDVSLSAGQITAVNGADSFNMTASTLTANGSSATWADIISNTNTAETLQAVLDASNSAENQSVNLTSAGASSQFSSTALSIVSDAGSSTMAVGSLVLMDAPNTSIATLAYNSVAVGKDTDYVEMTKDNLVLANSTVSATITPLSVAMGNATYNSAFVNPTAENGEKLVVSSSKQISLQAVEDISLSAGVDSLTFTKDAMLTTTAGGSTDQYLRVMINSIPYCISLLAFTSVPPPPSFPVLTFTNYNDPSGFSVFSPNPYNQSASYTVSITVASSSGANRFEVVSYATPTFSNTAYNILQTELVVGTTVYDIVNPTPERYNSLQIYKDVGGSLNITSFIINGTEQLVSPNPNPLIRP